MSAQPIKRGDLVRKKDGQHWYFGRALTAENERQRVRVRVEWHPDFGTWEEPGDLTVFNMLDLVKP